MTNKIISLICLTYFVYNGASYEHQLIDNMQKYTQAPQEMINDLKKLANETCDIQPFHDYPLPPLFVTFPQLAQTISYVHLGDFPTPIHYAHKLSTLLPLKALYIKCDNVSGALKNGIRLFGGNKVRKLEFLLADALAHHARSVITFGAAGSNHALATAVYSHELGLESILYLGKQHNSSIVQRNLALDRCYNAQIKYFPTQSLKAAQVVTEFLDHKLRYGTFPYIIPVGGSCPRGLLGFINAAYELKQQIDAGLMPEPDKIYVPLGSCGTAVGLYIGIQLLGLKSKLYAIAIEPEPRPQYFYNKCQKLFDETIHFLTKADPRFPQPTFDTLKFIINLDNCGAGYGLFTHEGNQARALLYDHEHITLDGVYSSKAFAGLLKTITKDDAHSIILFWNTFCSECCEEQCEDKTYLPQQLQHYFMSPVHDQNII